MERFSYYQEEKLNNLVKLFEELDASREEMIRLVMPFYFSMPKKDTTAYYGIPDEKRDPSLKKQAEKGNLVGKKRLKSSGGF